MNIALSIAVTVILTIFNGYFSMSEMALSTAHKVLLDHDAEEGDRRAATAADAVESPDRFLATIQVGITLLGFFSSAFAATSLSEPFGAWLSGFGLDQGFANGLATAIITLIVSYFSIVVGELVPKRMAMADAEGVTKRVIGPLSGFAHVVHPLVWLTAASANGLARLLHIKGIEDRQEVSEDEIRYMVRDSDELSDEEKSMIHEVIDLGDTKAREVMVPRVDVTFVEDDTTVGAVIDVMQDKGYSRIPIYHEDIDRIVGIAHIKDLIGPTMDNHEANASIKRYMRRADFVPDTKDIIPLLSEMRSTHDHMVIVVDEYGGTAGVLTIEDIVEEIVGEIEDEFDPDNKYLTQLSEREWLVDGRYSIDDAIELGWPIEDSEEYETIAGFVLDEFDGLPRPGDEIQLEGYTFHVQSLRGRRVSLVRVQAPEPQPDDQGEEDEQDDRSWRDRLGKGGRDEGDDKDDRPGKSDRSDGADQEPADREG